MNSQPNQDLILLFKKMMKDQEKITKEHKIYNEDIKDCPLKINWDIKGIIGYQIFVKDNYSYKFGERLENPDISLKFSDLEVAKKFLSGEIKGYSYIPQKEYKGLIKYVYAAGVEMRETDEGKREKKCQKLKLN